MKLFIRLLLVIIMLIVTHGLVDAYTIKQDLGPDGVVFGKRFETGTWAYHTDDMAVYYSPSEGYSNLGPGGNSAEFPSFSSYSIISEIGDLPTTAVNMKIDFVLDSWRTLQVNNFSEADFHAATPWGMFYLYSGNIIKYSWNLAEITSPLIVSIPLNESFQLFAIIQDHADVSMNPVVIDPSKEGYWSVDYTCMFHDAWISVPEPATMLLLGLGLVWIAGLRRIKRQQAHQQINISGETINLLTQAA